jgi:hypothetical protein
MADMNRFSERLIDVAERFADVVDAAEGKGARKSGPGARWLVLPAAGAAAYALATSSSSLARQTRGWMRKAKDRATDLPDTDLFDRVREVTGVEDETSSKPRKRTQGSRSQSGAGGTKRTSQRRRKTASAR